MSENVKLLKQYGWIIGSVAVIALIAFLFVLRGEKNRAMVTIESNPEWSETYQRALSREKQIKSEPDNFELYNAAMFLWKSLGDQTQQPYFYQRALRIAKKAEKNEKAQSALFNLNAGNIYKLLGDYRNAEKEYLRAIDLNTGDAIMWSAYLDLYINYAKKEPKEVLALFDRALTVLVDKTNVIIEKASYLTLIGEYQQALAIYQSLQIAYPDNSAFDSKVQELQLRLQNN